MSFKFTAKSAQKVGSYEMKGFESVKVSQTSFFKPSASPEKIKFAEKLDVATINERAFDDLTGASYVMDKNNSWTTAAKCEFVSEMAGWTFGTIAGGVATVYTSGVLSTAVGLSVQRAAKSGARMLLGEACLSSNGQEDSFREMVVDAILDTFDDEDAGSNANPDSDAESGNNDNDSSDTNSSDESSDEGSNEGSDEGSNEGSDEGSLLDSIVEFFTGDDDADAEAGGDEGNPNPYEDGSQGSTSKPTIGPAPGDIGGRYDSVLNPGSDRGFTPGNDDNGDGNPGNPWDRNERMSTPNDDGDSIDPVTGLGGGSNPSGPRDGIGGDPEDEDNGVDNELFRPNPEDDFGTGWASTSNGNTLFSEANFLQITGNSEGLMQASPGFNPVGVESFRDAFDMSAVQSLVPMMPAEAVAL